MEKSPSSRRRTELRVLTYNSVGEYSKGAEEFEKTKE